MNDLVTHAFTCRGECASNSLIAQPCGTLKQTIQHLRDCVETNCNICKHMNQLIQQHSATCSANACPVLNCTAIRGAAALQQLLSQSSLPTQKKVVSKSQSCPTTPEKPKGLSPFSSPLKSPLKCMKCQLPLTEHHVCSPSKTSRPDIETSSAAGNKFLLSPLRKRSYDAWAEMESTTAANESQVQPEVEIPSVILFPDGGEDDHEIITLPTNLRSPNKVPKIEKKRSHRRLSKEKTKWSTFSFQKLFGGASSSLTGGVKQPKGHIGEKSEESFEAPPHVRSKSWPGPGFAANTFLSSAANTQNQNEAVANASPLKPLFPRPDPIVIPPINTTRSVSFRANPLYEVTSPRRHHDDSDSAMVVSDQDILFSLLSPKHVTTSKAPEVVGAAGDRTPSVDSDEDLQEIDLSAITLDVSQENNEEWQKLMIYTPTSRNRPETRRSKPVIVRETVFEEKESNPSSLPTPTAASTLFQRVSSALPQVEAVEPMVPISQEEVLLEEMSRFTEELNNTATPKHSQLLKLLALSKENNTAVLEEDEEEVFYYLNKHPFFAQQPLSINTQEVVMG